MKVLIIKQALACLKQLTKLEEPLNLYGLIRRDENLAYILEVSKSNNTLALIGQIRTDFDSSFDIIGLKTNDDITFYYRQCERWIQIEKELIDLDDRLKRTPFQANLMEIICNSCVALVGVGSMGSRIALGLARTGIGHFKLADPDTFSIENVFRHECDLTDLKRYKVEAVKERILRVNPLAKIETYPFDIFKSEISKDDFFKTTNLVIATTDKISVQLQVNFNCLKKKIPALYAGCYSEARGGEILYVLPGETPICYECLRTGTQQESKAKKYIYSDAQDEEEYEGEPGLNAAINLISDVAEQYAIALILRKEECQIARLINPKRNLIFIGGALGKGFYFLKDTHCFSRPFEFIFPRIANTCSDCEACQGKP